MNDEQFEQMIDSLDAISDGVDRCASRLGWIVLFLYAPILLGVFGSCVYLGFLLVVANN